MKANYGPVTEGTPINLTRLSEQYAWEAAAGGWDCQFSTDEEGEEGAKEYLKREGCEDRAPATLSQRVATAWRAGSRLQLRSINERDWQG